MSDFFVHEWMYLQEGVNSPIEWQSLIYFSKCENLFISIYCLNPKKKISVYYVAVATLDQF